jgi:hypothetical protein
MPTTEEVLLNSEELQEIKVARDIINKEESAIQVKKEDSDGKDEESDSSDDASESSSGSDSEDDKSEPSEKKTEKAPKSSKKKSTPKKEPAAKPTKEAKAPSRDEHGRDSKGEYIDQKTFVKDRDALNANEKQHRDMFYNINDKLHDEEYIKSVTAGQKKNGNAPESATI